MSSVRVQTCAFRSVVIQFHRIAVRTAGLPWREQRPAATSGRWLNGLGVERIDRQLAAAAVSAGLLPGQPGGTPIRGPPGYMADWLGTIPGTSARLCGGRLLVAPGISVVPGSWGRATDIWGRAAGRCFSQSQPAVVTAILRKPKGIDSGTHGIAAHARQEKDSKRFLQALQDEY